MNPPIIVEQTFEASIETVWQAITQADQMKQWFFEDIESFEPLVDFSTRFTVHIEEGKDFVHLWKLTEVIPLKKIVYDWKYGGYPGESVVVFELFENGQKTILKITHTGIENFPSEVPEFSRESGIQGWKYFIQLRLKQFLESNHTTT